MLDNKKPLLIILALVVVLLTGAIFVTLQNANPSEERGRITGYIVDAADHSPLRGVTVTGEDQDGTQYTSHENTDTTGPDGFFSLELPPNDYYLLFEADGYQLFKSSAAYTVKNDDTLEVQEAFRLMALNTAEPDVGSDSPSAGGSPESGSAGGQVPPPEALEGAAGSQAAASPSSDQTAANEQASIDDPSASTDIPYSSETAEEKPEDSVAEGPAETVGLATILTFADPSLEKAVRSEMKLSENQMLTQDDALAVKALDLSGGGKDEIDKITDITGLSAFSNLEELDLQANRISDITELSSLRKLKKLQLEKNNVSDLTPLQGLDSLRKLEVASNAITDISPLFSLKRLELLDVINNSITSIKGIGSMAKLHTLRLGRNKITDIGPLAELQDLTHLGFGYNKVKDISALYDLPMLHVLTMNGNQVKDIGPVAYMPELYWLEVAGNPIEDTSILDNLPESVKHLER